MSTKTDAGSFKVLADVGERRVEIRFCDVDGNAVMTVGIAPDNARNLAALLLNAASSCEPKAEVKP